MIASPGFKPPDANRREQLPFYQRTKTLRQRELIVCSFCA